MMVLLQKHIR